MNKVINQATWMYLASLILLGIAGYILTGMQSITALIPTFFGLVILSVFIITKGMKKFSVLIWTLIVLGAIGFIATVNGIPKVITLINGETIVRSSAAISQSIMAVISLIYVVFIVIKNRS